MADKSLARMFKLKGTRHKSSKSGLGIIKVWLNSGRADRMLCDASTKLEQRRFGTGK